MEKLQVLWSPSAHFIFSARRDLFFFHVQTVPFPFVSEKSCQLEILGFFFVICIVRLNSILSSEAERK